jgi:hypothetical protein
MTARLNRLAERINVDADRRSLVRSVVSTRRQSKRQDLVSDAVRRILAMFDEDRRGGERRLSTTRMPIPKCDPTLMSPY